MFLSKVFRNASRLSRAVTHGLSSSNSSSNNSGGGPPLTSTELSRAPRAPPAVAGEGQAQRQRAPFVRVGAEDALNVKRKDGHTPSAKEKKPEGPGFAEIYGKAPEAKKEIDAMADKIAEANGGTVAKAPVKSEQRALEKINNDYGGDPTKIKDLARNTIIVDPSKIDTVTAQLAENGANVKVIDGATDPLGYSGVNSTIRTQSGLMSEIQVNSPAMIYAKEPELLARSLLGDATYAAVAARSGVSGGQGHGFYENWRVLSPDSAEAQLIAEKSRSYYDEIRRANGYQ